MVKGIITEKTISISLADCMLEVFPNQTVVFFLIFKTFKNYLVFD